jgi:hypothetical protein
MDAVIVNSISRFCTNEQAAEVESYFAANPLPKSSRRIGQSVESIRNTGAMLTRVKESQLVNPSYWA